MNHDDVVRALGALYPNVEWSYDGDGSTLDPVPGESYGLVWCGREPRPTLADLGTSLSGGAVDAVTPSLADAVAKLDPLTATVADVVRALQLLSASF